MGVAFTLFAVGCSRDLGDLERLENTAALERMSGGRLCGSARVVLENKQELIQHGDVTSFHYLVTAPPTCIDNYANTMFSRAELTMCPTEGVFACSREFNNDTVAMKRTAPGVARVHIW